MGCHRTESKTEVGGIDAPSRHRCSGADEDRTVDTDTRDTQWQQISKEPHVILAREDEEDEAEKQPQSRRKLPGFCEDCWQIAYLRHGKDEVPDMDFLYKAGVFKKAERLDPGARLKGKKKTMSYAEGVGKWNLGVE
jgi:hypothetical protein